MVNHNRDERMKINVRMTFFNLHCNSLSLDIADKFGENQDPTKIFKTVDKKPYKGDFPALRHAMKEEHPDMPTYEFEEMLWDTMWPEAGKAAAKKKKFAKIPPPAAGAKEGCMLQGHMTVNKVEGNFHLAVGESHSENGGHHHHWAAETRHLGFNASHYIHHLSFGEQFPGIVHPLDGFWFVEEGLASQQQYFIQVVPTRYVKSNQEQVDTNQYSITYNRTPVDPMSPMNTRLPGVFFKYQISPILIKVTEKPRSVAHLLTRICAVAGGIYVVIGMLYGTAHNAVAVVTKKRE